MSNKRMPNWSLAMSAARNDRAPRPEIREERMRTAGRWDPRLRPMTAWRGQDDRLGRARRYCGTIHPVADALDLTMGRTAVVLGVRRAETGLATIVDGAELCEGTAEIAAFCARVQAAGASELFVHILAESAADRAAILVDLGVTA